MKVEFTDLAARALTNLFGTTELRESWRSAIELKLMNDNVFDSARRLPRPDNKVLYLYALADLQITFESAEELRTVWTVTRAEPKKP